jgi:hypothetical protein
MKKYIVLLLFISLNLSLKAQNIGFYKEDLVFHLDSSHFLVNGDYYFLNPKGAKENTKISYPIPLVENQSVDSVFIFDYSTNRFIQPINQTIDNVEFIIPFRPKEKKKVNISYRQSHNGKQVTYILKTTKIWGTPLKDALFTMITDRKIKVDSFSYQPDTCLQIGVKKIFRWHKHNFMPKEDFKVHFHVME